MTSVQRLSFEKGKDVLVNGLGHIVAGVLAVPLGVNQYGRYDQTDRIIFLQENVPDGRDRDDNIDFRRQYQDSNPGIFGCIANAYRHLIS